MNVITFIPLADGPLARAEHTQSERVSRIAAMAHVLIDNACYADHGDSIVTLVECGRFSTAEIMMLIDDARQVATQHAVAMTMAWS